MNPLCVVDPNSFNKPLLWAHYDNSCLIEETDLFNYHIVNDFIDLICFVYGDEVKTYHASLIDGDGVISTTDRVILNAGSLTYESPVTGATYCLAYEIHLPDWQMTLEVKPLNKAQEMVFLTTNYWEGGISVCGRQGGRDVSGQGFMELIGSPAKKGLMNVYLQKIQQGGLKNNIRHLSAGIKNKFRAYR